MTKLALAALAVLTTTSLAACDGSYESPQGSDAAAPAAATAGPVDPCTILDETALEAVLGTDVAQDGPAEEQARGLTCSWTAGDGKVFVNSFHGSAFYAAGTVGPDLAGIGDEAQGEDGSVLFRQGEEVIGTQVLVPGLGERAVPLAQALAEAL